MYVSLQLLLTIFSKLTIEVDEEYKSFKDISDHKEFAETIKKVMLQVVIFNLK